MCAYAYKCTPYDMNERGWVQSIIFVFDVTRSDNPLEGRNMRIYHQTWFHPDDSYIAQMTAITDTTAKLTESIMHSSKSSTTIDHPWFSTVFTFWLETLNTSRCTERAKKCLFDICNRSGSSRESLPMSAYRIAGKTQRVQSMFNGKCVKRSWKIFRFSRLDPTLGEWLTPKAEFNKIPKWNS